MLELIHIIFPNFQPAQKRKKQSIHFRSLRFGLVVVGLAVLSSGFLVKQLPNTRVTYYQDDYFAYVQHIGRFQYRNETWDWRYWDRTTRQGSHPGLAFGLAAWFPWRHRRLQLAG